MINTAEELVNQDSVFHYYQELIALHKEGPILIDGAFYPLMEDDDSLFAYIRENEMSRLLVLCNFQEGPYGVPFAGEWENGEVLISNYPDNRPSELLHPYETTMVLLRKEPAL